MNPISTPSIQNHKCAILSPIGPKYIGVVSSKALYRHAELVDFYVVSIPSIKHHNYAIQFDIFLSGNAPSQVMRQMLLNNVGVVLSEASYK